MIESRLDTMKRSDESGLIAPAAFYILFALCEGEKHGYAIMQDVQRLSDGKFRMGPATLYTNIQRLLQEGLIDLADHPEGDTEVDSRRRYYRLAKTGRHALHEELDRMRSVLLRSKRLALKRNSAAV